MTTFTNSLPTQIAKQVDLATRTQGFATRSEFVRSLLRAHFLTEGLELEEYEAVPFLPQLKAELAQTGKYSEKFIGSVIQGFERSSAYKKDKATRVASGCCVQGLSTSRISWQPIRVAPYGEAEDLASFPCG